MDTSTDDPPPITATWPEAQYCQGVESPNASDEPSAQIQQASVTSLTQLNGLTLSAAPMTLTCRLTQQFHATTTRTPPHHADALEAVNGRSARRSSPSQNKRKCASSTMRWHQFTLGSHACSSGPITACSEPTYTPSASQVASAQTTSYTAKLPQTMKRFRPSNVSENACRAPTQTWRWCSLSTNNPPTIPRRHLTRTTDCSTGRMFCVTTTR